MNHLAGMILLMICKMVGILEIGKINPESIIVGSIKPINETIIAVCCEAVELEMSNPSDKEVIINKALSANNRKMLPFIGISSKKTLNTSIIIRLINERKK